MNNLGEHSVNLQRKQNKSFHRIFTRTLNPSIFSEVTGLQLWQHHYKMDTNPQMLLHWMKNYPNRITLKLI